MGKKQQRTLNASLSAMPEPFTPAPAQLKEFLETLDRAKVYITHLDRHPVAFKRRIFAVPVVLNVCISLLLLWRIYYIYPSYLDLVLWILGNPSPAAIDVKTTPWSVTARVVLGRAVMMGTDYFLATIVAMWPYTFFLESAGNPCRWRWRIGIQECEVVVRMSRGWGRDDLLGPANSSAGSSQGVAVKTGAESPFFKVRVLPAVERKWMQERTGYMMMGRDWDLDFQAMVDATVLVQKLKENKFDDFRKQVLAWMSEEAGWVCWQVWQLEEETSEAEDRRKIVAFKDKLTLMGKESLFFRWLEIVQYESSQSGGLTEERKQEAVRKARELFDSHAVDFDQFLASIGGVHEFPGLNGH